MQKLASLLLSAFFISSIFAQEFFWDSPINVSDASFGNISNSLALNTNGQPMVLHGSSGDNPGLFLSIMANGVFNDPIAVTSDTNIFLNDAEGPTMAVSGDNIVVAYQIAGEWAVGARVVISNNGGLSWSDPIALNGNPDIHFFLPCVAFDSNNSPFIGLKWGGNPTLEGIMTWNAFFGEFNAPVNGGEGMAGDAVCECCPSDPFFYDGTYYNIIRNNNNNIRDMWLAVSEDGINWNEALDLDPTNWLTNTCPATGASHTITDEGVLITTYMSAPNGNRVYYSEVDLNSLELINSGMIDPTSVYPENNPSVSANGGNVVTAWERNIGGYDIMVGLSSSTELSNEIYIEDVTEGLGINGHKRHPSVILDENIVHLIFKSQSEGVVKYLRGDLISNSINETDEEFFSLNSTSDSWIISGIDGEFNFSIIDLSGRLIKSGSFIISLEIEKLGGVHILNVYNESINQSFKLSN